MARIYDLQIHKLFQEKVLKPTILAVDENTSKFLSEVQGKTEAKRPASRKSKVMDPS